MDLRADERGQPVQIGFVLVLAFLVLGLALYQAVLVPQQNAEIEYAHFQAAESDMSGLQSEVTNAVASGRTRAASVDLGPGYPARLVGINPAPPSGTLRTNASGEVTFSGLGPSASDVCASDPGVSSVTTRTLEFRPGYNAYEEPRRIAYEHGLVARLFASGSLYGNQSLLLTGGTGPAAINLRLLTGEVSTSGTGAAVVDLHPSREYTTTVSPSGSFNVTIPGSLSASQWREALPPASTSNLTEIRANGDRVEFEFTAGTYELSCAAVGLNSKPAYQPPEPTPGSGGGQAFQVTWESPAGQQGTSSCSASDCTLDAGTSQTLDLRGMTDPPAEGASFDFALNNSSVATLNRSSAVTGPDGEAAVELSAESNGVVAVYVSGGGGGDVINVTVEGFTGDPPTASIDQVTDNSQCIGDACSGRNIANFSVDWSATDDDGIQSVQLELVDSTGTVVDTASPPASGTSDSGTVTLEEQGGWEQTYTIEMTVTDTSGLTGTDSETQVADGSDTT